jgi:hypothetical protein
VNIAKRPGREADHSPPFRAEVKNTWRYNSTPPYVSVAWYLLKHRDRFALLYFILPYTETIKDQNLQECYVNNIFCCHIMYQLLSPYFCLVSLN